MPDIPSGEARPRPAKDRFAATVYALVAAMAVAELFALSWLDLF